MSTLKWTSVEKHALFGQMVYYDTCQQELTDPVLTSQTLTLWVKLMNENDYNLHYALW